MKKVVLFIIISQVFVAVYSQKYHTGDYIEIDNIPAFVFYVDESGEHGMVMSFPNMKDKEIKKLGKEARKELGEQEQSCAQLLSQMPPLSISGYAQADLFKPKKKKLFFEKITPRLGNDGAENQRIIAAYCQEQGLSMETYFPWEHYAQQLGEEWFVPGNDELEKFAIFFIGGLGSKHSKGTLKFFKQRKKVSSDVRVQFALSLIIFSGIISSTSREASSGFCSLNHITRTLPPDDWLEIIDDWKSKSDEDKVRVCCVRKI